MKPEIRHPNHKILARRMQAELPSIEWSQPEDEVVVAFKNAASVHRQRNQEPRSFKKALIKQVIREELGVQA